MDHNPQVKAELTGIRQPLVDIKNRCGVSTARPPFRRLRAGWQGGAS